MNERILNRFVGNSLTNRMKLTLHLRVIILNTGMLSLLEMDPMNEKVTRTVYSCDQVLETCAHV